MDVRRALRFGSSLVLAFGLVQGPVSAQYGQSGMSTEQAAEMGDRLYYSGAYASAAPYLTAAARGGNAHAQTLLAAMYFSGNGVPQDQAEAGKLYRAAAAQGNRVAIYMLGGMYTDGLGGFPKDSTTAASYFARSASLGYPNAMEALGVSYEFGMGVPRSRSTALSWLRRAAAAGDRSAAFLASWLGDPSTPRFRTQAQMASYILAHSQTQQSWAASNGGSARQVTPQMQRYLSCVSLGQGTSLTCYK